MFSIISFNIKIKESALFTLAVFVAFIIAFMLVILVKSTSITLSSCKCLVTNSVSYISIKYMFLIRLF